MRWAAFLCTINPNTGSEENKRRLINLFKILLTNPRYRYRVSTPAFGTRHSPEDVKLVLFTRQSTVSIERENGLHAHVYIIWAWRRQHTKNEYQVNIPVIKSVLSTIMGREAVDASHINIKFSRTNPNIYALDMVREYNHYWRIQNLPPTRPRHEPSHADEEPQRLQ